ncbi:helix-turn-helix domain-containing protein [Cryobacterium sp. M15]|uniref:helix-turn-helix domain-containing protein n=1 Tax=Cryobacterium sp. M15 TaxID=2048291 RepID=UPI003518EE72
MGRKSKPLEQRIAFVTAGASGTSLRKSAVLAGISRFTACLWLKRSGGARLRATKPCRALRLSLDERESISQGLAVHRSLTAIATELGCAVPTVSRDVLRDGGSNGYRSAQLNVSPPLEHGHDWGNSPSIIGSASTWNPSSLSAGLRNRSPRRWSRRSQTTSVWTSQRDRINLPVGAGLARSPWPLGAKSDGIIAALIDTAHIVPAMRPVHIR